jgi:hypothetical protein
MLDKFIRKTSERASKEIYKCLICFGKKDKVLIRVIHATLILISLKDPREYLKTLMLDIIFNTY